MPIHDPFAGPAVSDAALWEWALRYAWKAGCRIIWRLTHGDGQPSRKLSRFEKIWLVGTFICGLARGWMPLPERPQPFLVSWTPTSSWLRGLSPYFRTPPTLARLPVELYTEPGSSLEDDELV